MGSGHCTHEESSSHQHQGLLGKSSDTHKDYSYLRGSVYSRIHKSKEFMNEVLC